MIPKLSLQGYERTTTPVMARAVGGRSGEKEEKESEEVQYGRANDWKQVIWPNLLFLCLFTKDFYVSMYFPQPLQLRMPGGGIYILYNIYKSPPYSAPLSKSAFLTN
jgi:hypothetical protein